MNNWIRLRARVALALLLAAAVLSTAPGPAAAMDCTTTDVYGEERECTASEEFKRCISHSLDAYIQCVGTWPERMSWRERIDYELTLVGCQVWAGVDQVACTASLPLDLIL